MRLVKCDGEGLVFSGLASRYDVLPPTWWRTCVVRVARWCLRAASGIADAARWLKVPEMAAGALLVLKWTLVVAAWLVGAAIVIPLLVVVLILGALFA